MDDEQLDGTLLLEKRNFHLALSIVNGQHLAHISGFSVPSEDVQKQEIMDVVSKWLAIKATGVMDEVHKCSNWIIDTTSKVNDYNDEYQENSRLFLASYSIALLTHLIDGGFINFSHRQVEGIDDSIEFLKQMFTGE